MTTSAGQRGVVILGSTGSIGVNTLDVVARHPDSFRVLGLTANTDDARMAEQCLRWRPMLAAMADADAAERLRLRLRDGERDRRYSRRCEGFLKFGAGERRPAVHDRDAAADILAKVVLIDGRAEAFVMGTERIQDLPDDAVLLVVAERHLGGNPRRNADR